MRTLSASLALILSLSLAAGAFAQCESKAKAASEGQIVAACDGKAIAAKNGCTKTAECTTPKMAYKVGDKTTCCPEEAAQLAGSNGQIHFVVAGQEYSDKTEAMKAYVKALDEEVAQYTTIRYAVGEAEMCCSKMAGALAKSKNADVKYRVANFTFDQEVKAEQAAKLAGEAVKRVKVTCVVDGKEIECDMSCCDSKMQLTAAKGDGDCAATCGSAKATTVAGKEDCSKTCDGAKATTVAGKEDCSKTCDGAKATTVAGKEDCSKTCDGAKATTVAGKSDTTCDSAKATMVAQGEGCDPEACSKAKSHQWVVGDMKTDCQVTARIELAKARLEAARKAIEQVAGV